MEQWRDIEGYPNYEVSNLGRVRNNKGLIRKHRLDKYGYPYLNLSDNGKKKTFKVHRLVAMVFIDNVENKPTVNHIDGVKDNNHVSNLEWNTWAENSKHAYDNGLFPQHQETSNKGGEGARKAFGTKVTCFEIGTGKLYEFESFNHAGEVIGVSGTTISRKLKKGITEYRGFTLAYTEGVV